jgi:autotransporter translocation and assembly factor TamB
MQEEIKPQPEKKSSLTGIQRAARIVLKVILFLFLFIIVLFLLILTPPVQRFATSRVENFLEKKLQTKVDIGSISIGLPRNVQLKNIFIADRSGDTLIAGGLIKADIALFDLLSNKVSIKDIELKDITAKVKRTCRIPFSIFSLSLMHLPRKSGG